jgi:N-succinyldiaminopimelate aminotransferase
MNPRLDQLQPYPFQRLRKLFEGIAPNRDLEPIALSIGEPKHPTPGFISEALASHLDQLAYYPETRGKPALREAIAAWCHRRYGAKLDPEREVLPVNGTREALFAFAQTVVNSKLHEKWVVMPNPFYQIYEGATLLAAAQPVFLNTTPDNGFRMQFDRLPETVRARIQLVYVCTPGNPTGRVMTLDDWRELFRLSDEHGFVIASDECYSEIYFDEAQPPLGALTAARSIGRGLDRLVVFNSLSKRSNAPGMRSGFVAGDPAVLEKFLLYRTYHGSAMNPAVQAASIAAWGNDTHVRDNRCLYRDKFDAVFPILREALPAEMPEAGFYFWTRVVGEDTDFARELYARQNVTVLPGSFLARETPQGNPGKGFVRIALVAPQEDCVEAARRIVEHVRASR